MADISKITLPSNDEYNIKDATARQDIAGKQDVITVDGILQGDGEGNISAAETEEVTTLTIDSAPTPGSNHLVMSGGVWNAIQNAGGGSGSGGDIASTTSILKGDGSGGAVAAIEGVDYQAPLTEGVDYATPSDIPTKTSDLTNDSGFLTSHQDISGKIDTAGTGLSKSGTTLNHSNSITAQTTQALYPIKIDGQGHISAYGSAVTIPDVSGKIDTAGSGLSKSGTTLNHSNSITAQSTQAIYPIKIDATGHISGYGNAVTIPKQGTWYGTCSTTASTAAKSVTCSGFELTAGNIIGILFTTANTAATPTLSVNSTTATSIYVGNSTPTSTDNVLKWSANTMIYFMYDGTYYRYITSISAGSIVPSRGANTWYGTSSTTASTQAKTSTIDNFVLTKGSVVYITFSTANTYTSAKITLNINSTGAKDIYYNNAVTSSTNTLLWDAGETLTFIYSGSYYYFVNKTKSPVISVNGQTGAVTISMPSAADATPLMDSTASVGTSTDYAREDHVHPVDTSRAAASHTHGDITNTGDITATAPTIASGDKIIINDESASKITNGPSFGTSTTTYLRNDGSWNTPTDNRDPGYGKIQPGAASSSTSAITANTTTAQASTYNETLTINPGNKWVSVAGSNSSTSGSDTFTIGHSAGLTAKTSYGSTSTTASANGGSITVTDIKYDEAGHITSSTDRTITLSQSTTPASHASTATTYGVGNASNYGHVKLSDSTSSTNGTSNGTAATPAAVKAAYDLTLARTKIYTGSCSTAATTAAKVVTLDDATGFSLTDGVKVAVYFSQGNETTGTTTLNVNNTGAKNVYFYGDDNVGMYYTAGAIYNQWGYGETLIFTYVTNGWFHTPSQYFTDLTYKLANSNKFPSQSGNSGKYLTTNGSSVSWASVDALPSQTGNSGKYLTTNGTTASWDSINVPDITYGNTDLTPGVSSLATGSIYLFYE